MISDQQRAHKAVRYALSVDRLTRPETCEACGRRGKPDAHHEDYSRPLDVRWLCRRCHKRVHCGTFASGILENLLDERDLLPLELAVLTGIPVGTIDGWLRNRRTPRRRAAERLGEFFDVDWREFREAA